MSKTTDEWVNPKDFAKYIQVKRKMRKWYRKVFLVRKNIKNKPYWNGFWYFTVRTGSGKKSYMMRGGRAGIAELKNEVLLLQLALEQSKQNTLDTIINKV